MNVFEWSAAELAQKIKAGELSAPEAVEAVIALPLTARTALITATPH